MLEVYSVHVVVCLSFYGHQLFWQMVLSHCNFKDIMKFISFVIVASDLCHNIITLLHYLIYISPFTHQFLGFESQLLISGSAAVPPPPAPPPPATPLQLLRPPLQCCISTETAQQRKRVWLWIILRDRLMFAGPQSEWQFRHASSKSSSCPYLPYLMNMHESLVPFSRGWICLPEHVVVRGKKVRLHALAAVWVSLGDGEYYLIYLWTFFNFWLFVSPLPGRYWP